MNQMQMQKQHKYRLTSTSAMKWAKHELDHMGRIASVEDPDIQYSYAMSTLYGMLHLRNALRELASDPAYSFQREDLLRTYDQVMRAIKHLIKDYSLDVNTVQIFNTRGVLGDLSNVKGSSSTPMSMPMSTPMSTPTSTPTSTTPPVTPNTTMPTALQMPSWANVSAAKNASKLAANKLAANKLAANKLAANKLAANKLAANKLAANKLAANAARVRVNATRVSMNAKRNSKVNSIKRNNVTQKKPPFWFLGF